MTTDWSCTRLELTEKGSDPDVDHFPTQLTVMAPSGLMEGTVARIYVAKYEGEGIDLTEEQLVHLRDTITEIIGGW